MESDWKSKSLDPLPMEKYDFKLDIEISNQKQEDQVEEKSSFLKRIFGGKLEKKNDDSKKPEKTLPNPKIAKINDRIFCMAIDKELKILLL